MAQPAILRPCFSQIMSVHAKESQFPSVHGHVQAHFAQLNARDEAMSRSLNSDYLDQLLIRSSPARCIPLLQGTELFSSP